MKKITAIFFSILIALLLIACGEDQVDQIVIPSFRHLVIIDKPEEADRIEVEKNTEVRIEIHLNNPSALPIGSVRISGITYRSRTFETGSTASKIVLHIDSGPISRLITYEVERFEYVRDDIGTTVTIVNNNTFNVFVKKSMPTVTVSSIQSTSTQLSMQVVVNDTDNVIISESAFAYLTFEDEDPIVKPLNIGSANTLIFSDLYSSQPHTLTIIVDHHDLADAVTVYEDVVLMSNTALSTLAKVVPTVSIVNVRTSETSITFDVSVIDPNNVLQEDSLKAILIRDSDQTTTETNLDSSTLLNITFDQEILNNNEYTILIEGAYDLNIYDGSGAFTDELLTNLQVTTNPYSLPEVTATIVSHSQTHLEMTLTTGVLFEGIEYFDMVEAILTDENQNVLAIGVLLDNVLRFAVEGLLADQIINVSVEVVFDLGDGQGEQSTIVDVLTHHTLATVVPTASISDITLEQTSLRFQTVLNNPSFTAISGSFIAMLYENDTLIGSPLSLPLSSGTYTFSDIDVYYENTYTIKLFINYDLRDGQGPQDESKLQFTYSKTASHPKEPNFIITTGNGLVDSIVFEFLIEDNDHVGALTEINLYLDGILIESLTNMTLRIFEGLLSNQTYVLEALYIYDLEDGSLPKTHIRTLEIDTLGKASPSAQIENIEMTIGFLAFDVLIEDENHTIVPNQLFAILRDDSDQILASYPITSLTESFTFTQFIYGKSITISIEGDIDYNDTTAIIVADVLAEHSLIMPAIEHTIIQITESEIIVQLDMIELDSIVDWSSVIGRVYDLDDTLIVHGQLLDKVMRFQVNGLLSDETLRFVIEADYDLGLGPDSGTVYEFNVTSTANNKPTVYISDGITANQMGFEFALVVTDPDQTLASGSLTVYVYEDGVLVDTVTASDQGGITAIPYPVTYQTMYTLIVKADYNLRDGNSIQEDYHLYTTYAQTSIRPQAPIAQFDNIVVSSSGITFDYQAYDNDTIIVTDGLVLEINGIPTVLSELSDTITLSLFSDSSYTIRIIASYDRNDGEGEVSKVLIAYTFDTLANEEPTLTIEELVATDASVEFEINVVDPDQVFNAITAIKLYKDGVLVEALVDLNLRTFLGLLPNTTYEIEVTYTFDLNDNQSTQIETISIEFTTLE